LDGRNCLEWLALLIEVLVACWLCFHLAIRGYGYQAENFGGNQTDEREFLVELILRFFVRE